MSAAKKTTIPLQTLHNDLKHNRRSCNDGGANCGFTLGERILRNPVMVIDNKENVMPNKPEKMGNDDENCRTNGFTLGERILQNPIMVTDNKENVTPNKAEKMGDEDRGDASGKSQLKDGVLKPSSLQLCIQKNEPDSKIGGKIWEFADSDKNNSANIWDHSDSEAAPASSWSTLPNRSLLYRPLPLDIGRCTCIIVKEVSPEGLDGSLFSLYTHEGHGRQNRKLAIAHHRKRGGRSEFVVAQNRKGILSSSDDSLIGKVTANFMGSKYHISDQESVRKSRSKQSKLLGVVRFMPTITTLAGSYRSMKAWIPKHQSMQLKNTTTQVQHINGLPEDWEEKMDKVHQLFSSTPHYNKISKHYELDFRDKGRAGLRIQSSVKNFQLTLEKHGKQTTLQLGRVGKLKYVMDYRYPLTGYQAFCICLASIDSKLCCTV